MWTLWRVIGIGSLRRMRTVVLCSMWGTRSQDGQVQSTPQNQTLMDGDQWVVDVLFILCWWSFGVCLSGQLK
jgi:hypothetical protein